MNFGTFFKKHIRILPQIHCHHLQLNPRSVEASREMATSGVNISSKWNSQNGSMVFLGSPKVPNNMYYTSSWVKICVDWPAKEGCERELE